MILRSSPRRTLGGTWGPSTAPVTNRVITIDPAHPPSWIPSGATIVYKSASPPAAPVPPIVTQPIATPPAATPPAIQAELIPQYSQPTEQRAGLQRPTEIPIEQAIEKPAVAAPAKESGSLVPIIVAIILAIVAGQ